MSFNWFIAKSNCPEAGVKAVELCTWEREEKTKKRAVGKKLVDRRRWGNCLSFWSVHQFCLVAQKTQPKLSPHR